MIHRLATYGTLAPGRPNAHVLDEFEGSGYRRVPVSVSGDTGEVAAYVYALADDSAQAC